MRRHLLLLCLAAAALPAGCGDLPRPFQGNPGATAQRLAQPPPARLAVAPPGTALLGDDQAVALAGDLAASLQQASIPAVAAPALGDHGHPGDWHLEVTAQLQGTRVVPTFTVTNPRGVGQGSVQGAPVDAADWQAGRSATLQQVADAAAPAIASLLTSIEAARQQSDPNSLVNRPARVYVAEVVGAKGDGDDALTHQMRQSLPTHGDVVQTTAAGADYTVLGHVVLGPAVKGSQRVEVAWQVNDATGADCGRVTQLNDVPAGSLDTYWGDVAVVVAQQAAGGVHEVISNRVIGRVPRKPDKAPS
jgi:hypothetical protein